MHKHLVFRVCAEDFAKFRDGTETSRHREATPHWTSRLVEKDGTFKKFDEIYIINGYKADSPTIIADFWKIIQNENGFEIKLGKIKEIKNNN